MAATVTLLAACVVFSAPPPNMSGPGTSAALHRAVPPALLGSDKALEAERVVADVCAVELALAVLNHERIVLDVYSTWCGPCALLAPHLEVAARSLDCVKVLKFNTDRVDGPAMASLLEVEGLPALLFISRGEVVHRTE